MVWEIFRLPLSFLSKTNRFWGLSDVCSRVMSDGAKIWSR